MYTPTCAQGGTFITKIFAKNGEPLEIRSLCNGRTLCGCPGWSEKLTGFVEHSLQNLEERRYRYFAPVRDVAKAERQNHKHTWLVLAALTPHGEIAAVCWLGCGRVRARDNKLVPTDVVEAAFVTAPEWRGQGLTRRLTEAALELCKERWVGVELEATALCENTAMTKSLYRLHQEHPGSTYKMVDGTRDLRIPIREGTLVEAIADLACLPIGILGYWAEAPLRAYRKLLVKIQQERRQALLEAKRA